MKWGPSIFKAEFDAMCCVFTIAVLDLVSTDSLCKPKKLSSNQAQLVMLLCLWTLIGIQSWDKWK